ncbi:MAG TPA: DUF4062 domain-containing protein [Thermoanaerobaculia bacterium]|nr:DUF4062 domain-containing protein [Thermoanaerobaculia bacterium]
MISSTFFDLKQVRSDLARFLGEQLGCIPLVSEWPSFPIDPDVNTIENCRRRVEHEADVLILIIGGRYGSVDSTSSRSVTNIEYLTARAKGIPVYVFVERKVMSVLSVWRANKTGDFSSVVDDHRVFDFVEEVRDLHKVWMREFDLANEIVEALRAQFAYLTLQGALLTQRARDGREYSTIRGLSGAPLRVALEQPPGWEYKLFAEVLIQEVGARRNLREQLRLGITHGPFEGLAMEDFHSWGKVRVEELVRILEALKTLGNKELKRALGPMGESGDIEHLVFTARSIADLYQEAIEWGLRIRRVVPKEDVNCVVRTMEGFADDILEKLEAFGPLVLQEIDSLVEASRRGELVGTGSVILNLELPGLDEFTKAMAQLRQKLSS